MADEGMIPVGGLEAEIRLETNGIDAEFARLSALILSAQKRLEELQREIDRTAETQRTLAAGNVAVAAAQDKVTSSVEASAGAYKGQIGAMNEVVNMMLAMYAKEGAAVEAAELKDAERLAKLVANEERLEAKRAEAAERAALKDAERVARLIANEEKLEAKRQEAASREAVHGGMAGNNEAVNIALTMYAKEAAAADKAAAAEDARLARVEAAHHASLAKRDSEAEAAALKDAERLAKLAAQAEAFDARQEASAQKRAAAEIAASNDVVNVMLADDAREQASRDKASAAEDARLARVEAAHHATLARQDADAESAALKEAERIARMVKAYEDGEARKQAAVSRRAVDGGNFVIGNMVIQPGQLQALVAAEQADVIAKRQMANEAAGVAREQSHLNAVIRDGVGEMLIERTAVVNVTAAAGGMGAAVAGAGNAMYAAQGRSNAFARGLMQVGFVIDDIQYGFQSVVNNVGPLSQMFAQAAGASVTSANAIGASAQIIAVAGYQAAKHWNEFREAVSEGIEIPKLRGAEELDADLKKIQARIRALQEKGKVFTLEEKDEYDKDVKRAAVLKEEVDDRKATDKLVEGKSKQQQEVATGFQEAVSESGGKEALDELVAALKQQTVEPAAAEAAMIASGQTIEVEQKSEKGVVGKTWDAVKSPFVPDPETPQAKAATKAKKLAEQGVVLDPEDNVFRTPEEMARKEFARAAAGDTNARKRIADSLHAGSETGYSKFGESIEKFDPETKEKIKENDEKARDFEQDRKKQQADAERKRKQDQELDREGRRKNLDTAGFVLREKTGAELSHVAGRERSRVDRGGQTVPEAKERITKQLVDAGLNEDDAKEAAAEAYAKTSDDTPEERKKRIDRQNRAKAKELGVDKDADVAAFQAVALGKGTEEAAKAIREKLVAKGMDELEADDTAKSFLDEGSKKARQKFGDMTREANRPDEQQPSRSEVFNTAQLTSRVQSGVTDGASEPKKHTDLLTKVNEHLEKLANRQTLEFVTD